MGTAAVFPRQPPCLRPEGAQDGNLTSSHSSSGHGWHNLLEPVTLIENASHPRFPAASPIKIFIPADCDNQDMEELCRYAICLFSCLP